MQRFRKPLTIAWVIFLVLTLAVGGYFGLEHLRISAVKKDIDTALSEGAMQTTKGRAQLLALVNKGLEYRADDHMLLQNRLTLRITSGDLEGGLEDAIKMQRTVEVQQLICIIKERLGKSTEEVQECYAAVIKRLEEEMIEFPGDTEKDKIYVKLRYAMALLLAGHPDAESAVRAVEASIPAEAKDEYATLLDVLKNFDKEEFLKEIFEPDSI